MEVQRLPRLLGFISFILVGVAKPPNLTCRLQVGKVLKNCAAFKHTVSHLNDARWVLQKFNVTETTALLDDDSHLYANISLEIEKPSYLDWTLYLVQYCDAWPEIQLSWQLQPSASVEEILAPSMLLRVDFVPVSENCRHFEVRLMIPSMDFNKDKVSTCTKAEYQEDCEILYTTGLTILPHPYHRTLSVGMHPRRKFPVSVELVSGPCYINCTGGTYNCHVNISTAQLLNHSRDVVEFQGLDEGFHCARIGPANHKCCLICTETVELREPAQLENIVVARSFSLTKHYVILSSITITAVGLITVALITRKLYGRGCHGLNQWSGSLYSAINAETVEFNKALTNPIMQAEVVKVLEFPCPSAGLQVLLIYSRQDQMIQHVIEAFTTLLETNNIKVLDPLSETDVEEVSQSPNAWTERYLTNPDVRILLVESLIGVQRQEAWIQGSHFYNDDQHHLDHMFLLALTTLHANPLLRHDYQRLFIARFDNFSNERRFTNIVPCTRYQMPDHFKSLVLDLFGTQTGCQLNLDELLLQRPTEWIAFQEAINKYNKDHSVHKNM